MKKQTDYNLLFCTIVGCVADLIAIYISIKSLSSVTPILIIVFVGLIFLIVQLYNKYRERRDFISFIQYLFDNNFHNFNLLPKICLALDKSGETNDLAVENMTIKYTYDMRNINVDTISQDDIINYYDTIEYDLRVRNKNIPKEFVCYRGNMKSYDDCIEIFQKHGNQIDYERVPCPRHTDETKNNVDIQKYSWQIKDENITKGKIFTHNFKFRYLEKATANSNDTIVFYPKQYAKEIETVEFQIEFLCDRNILKKVELFKVWKDGKQFKHTPVAGIDLRDNVAASKIQPDTSKHEAYYFRLYWELTQ